MSKKTKILSGHAIKQKVDRIAWEIYENNLAFNEIILVGICGRGELLAKMISKSLDEISLIKTRLAILVLDKDNPYQNKVKINLNISDYSGKVVVLVDDVLNSGKTLMFAARYFLTTPLLKLSTVVLIDRNHNRYPIKADYIGLSLATTLKEYITVTLTGRDKGVYLS